MTANDETRGPRPTAEGPDASHIVLAHGGGGQLTDELLTGSILPRLRKLHETTKDAETKARLRFIMDKLGSAPKEKDEDPTNTKPKMTPRPRS